MPGAVLGSRVTAVDRGKAPALSELTLRWERQTINKSSSESMFCRGEECCRGMEIRTRRTRMLGRGVACRLHVELRGPPSGNIWVWT